MRASVVLPEPLSPMMVKISGLSAPTAEADVASTAANVLADEQAAHREELGDVVDFEQRGSCGSSHAAGGRLHQRLDIAASASRRCGDPDATVSSGGTSVLHLSMASGQRGWKRQPRRRLGEVGRAALEGRPLRGVADARQARDEVRRVGMLGRREQRARRRLLDQAAGIDDADAVGDVGMHAPCHG